MGVTSTAYFIVVLDAPVVVTALPQMQRDLHVGISSLQWTMNACGIAFAAGIITATALGDRFVFNGGLAVFTIASAVCALVPAPSELIVARTIQGLGAAVVLPLSLTILTTAFPIVGGAIAEAVDGHRIFWINVPIGLLASLLGVIADRVDRRLLLGIADVFSNRRNAADDAVDTGELGLANSRLQGSAVLCQQLVGPPIGAFLFSVGRAWPFLAQAIIVVAAVPLVWQIGSRKLSFAGPPRSRIRSDVQEGSGGSCTTPSPDPGADHPIAQRTWGAAWSVLVLYALHHLHVSKVGYALPSTSSAVGGVLAIVLCRRLEQRWRWRASCACASAWRS